MKGKTVYPINNPCPDRSDALENDQGAQLLALVAAAGAGARGETPVGAVLRDPLGRFLVEGGNGTLQTADPVGHAEIRVLRLAAARVGRDRLPGAILTVSLAPCSLCVQAALVARIARIQYAAHRQCPPPSILALEQGGSADNVRVAGGLLKFFFAERRKK